MTFSSCSAHSIWSALYTASKNVPLGIINLQLDNLLSETRSHNTPHFIRIHVSHSPSP